MSMGLDLRDTTAGNCAPKFKVGDEVKVVAPFIAWHYQRGSYGRVVSVDCDGDLRVRFNHWTSEHYRDDLLALVKPSEVVLATRNPHPDTRPKLIALYSPAPQSGKSTTADRLRDKHGYELIKFAGPLKAMLWELLVYAGLSHKERNEALEGATKSTPIAALGGKTPRELLQTLGTEWGRNLVSETLWTDCAMRNATTAKMPVVFDDMRFPNELAAVRAAGGITVKIVRDAAGAASDGHASEGALDGEQFDYVIENNGSVEALGHLVDMLAANTDTVQVRCAASPDGLARLSRGEDVARHAAATSEVKTEAAAPEPFCITGPGIYRTRGGETVLQILLRRLDGEGVGFWIGEDAWGRLDDGTVRNVPGRIDEAFVARIGDLP